MRKLFFLFSIFNFYVHAQDTIRFRNGEVKAVKVSEVGIDNIKYNRFDNIRGPVYIINKNEIQLIKYSGGGVDSFKLEQAEVQKAEVKKQEGVTLEQSVAQNNPGKIMVQRNRLYYNNKAVGESRLLKLIMAYPDNNKQNRMLQSFKQMKVHKKKQYLFGIVGLAVGLGAPYIGAMTTLILDYPDQRPGFFLAGIIIGAGVGITGTVISSIHKHKRLEKRLEVVRIFNGDI